MKTLLKFLGGALLLAGLQFAGTGCVADGYVSEGVYYGPQRDPWFRDDPWMDHRNWHDNEPNTTIGLYIHPPRSNRRH